MPDALSPTPVQPPTELKWYGAIPPAVVVALLVTAFVSVLVLAGSELAFSRLSDTQQRLWLLVDARVSLLKMQQSVVQAESAQRGFLITGEVRYLGPFEGASDMATFELSTVVGKLGRYDKLNQESITLGNLLQKKQQEMALTVHLANEGRREEALAILHTDTGLKQMDGIKQASRALDEHILDETREMDQELLRLGKRQRFGVGGLVCLNLVFLAALAGRTIKHFYEREIQRQMLARQADELERAVVARTAELAELSTYLQDQSEKERAVLARNLHDEFGALLTAAKLDVAWLQGHNPGDDLPRTERLNRLSDELDQAVDLKRVVIESLRPSLLDQLGLSAALSWLVEEGCQRAGLQADIDVQEVAADQAVSLTLYRIAQEALTNIIKHAHAKRVTLTLHASAEYIELRMADDGVGLPTTGTSSVHGRHGLQGMAHRVHSHLGRLDMVSTPGQGTVLTVVIPRSQVQDAA